jgi:hypothetical protein
MMTVCRTDEGGLRVEGGTAEERDEVNQLLTFGRLVMVLSLMDVDGVRKAAIAVLNERYRQKAAASKAGPVETSADAVPVA